MQIKKLRHQKMRKLYIVISLLGLLMSCTQTPPLDRVYNEKTVVRDIHEIKEFLEPTDFALLENEINDHYIGNEGMVKKISYIQILNSIKIEIQKEIEIQLEEQRLAKEQRLLEEQRLIKQQPVQFLHATDSGFEEFSFSLFGNKHKTVGYRIKGKLINMSDKTFVNVEFVDKSNSFWANAQRNPYVEINLHNAFRLACVDFGSSFSNWKKIKNIDLPTASYESPWRAGEIQSFELYFQPDVTRGYYIGVDDYGECLQPVHFNYEPNSCLLIIPIYLEDSKGYKKQTFLSFDIMDDYKNLNKNNP